VLSRRASIHPPGQLADPVELAAITALIADRERSRGFRPFSDQAWVDLVHGAATRTISVQALAGDGTMAGYAQAAATQAQGSANPAESSWTVEAVIADDDTPERVTEVGGLLLDAAIDAIGAAGGTELTWLVQGPGQAHEALAGAHGLTCGRRLLQMRRPLPTGLDFEIQTRSFDPDRDIAEWLQVNGRAFAWNPEQGSWTEDNVLARIDEPWFDPRGFLIHDRLGSDGEVRMAGFCWTKIHAATEASAALGEIYVIAVDPDFHGLGLGRQLTLAGLDSLAGRGITTGMLFVDAANTAGVTLYDKLGFIVHRTDCVYTGPVGAGAGGEARPR